MQVMTVVAMCVELLCRVDVIVYGAVSGYGKETGL
jgi:hypothetical protein